MVLIIVTELTRPLVGATGSMVWYNIEVARPFGLDLLQERLANGFYRQVEAIVHDAQELAANAAWFNGSDSPIANRAQGTHRAAAFLMSGSLDRLTLLMETVGRRGQPLAFMAHDKAGSRGVHGWGSSMEREMLCTACITG